MARRWGKAKKAKMQQRRQQRQQERASQEDKPQHEDYPVSTIVQDGNFKLEAYYAAQGLHHSHVVAASTNDDINSSSQEVTAVTTFEEFEQERLRWRSIIGETLPSSFRIGKQVPESVRACMKKQLADLVQNHGVLVKPLGFAPDDAYQLPMDRTRLRKDPAHEKLHQWLVQQTEAGFVSRQETVSMIPPIVLMEQQPEQQRAGTVVLDMCAAPGSKSCQLLEYILENDKDTTTATSSSCLVANDANAQRAHMLVHQLKRVSITNPLVLITNCPAQYFNSTVQQFDSILADVPCTGDGTTRKNVGIWKSWSQLGALNLHVLQLDIAWQGVARLLRVGGYLCYSTCSYNPIENEAVVAELLRRSKGALELVEISLPNFVTRPGMTKWHVFCEEQSQRQINNAKKKGNEKMQRKRTEYAKKQQQEKESNATVPADSFNGNKEENAEDKKYQSDNNGAHEDAAAESRIDGEDTSLAFEAANTAERESSVLQVETASIETKETDEEKEKLTGENSNRKKKFQPRNMDEKYLIDQAVSAGLLHLPTPSHVPDKLKDRVRDSSFPPSSQEVKVFHLERCIRCMPQDNDTGGFFVALLKKVAPISARDRRAARVAADQTGTEPDPKRTKVVDKVLEDNNLDEEDEEEKVTVKMPATRHSNSQSKGNLVRDENGNIHPDGHGIDDFVPVADDILDPLIDFYGLTSPSFRKDLYMTRAGGDQKIIYFIASPVKKLIDAGLQKKVTVVNSGLKGFNRNSTSKECSITYRISQEGAHFLAPHMTKRKFIVSRPDFDLFLSSATSGIPLTSLSEEFQKVVRPIQVGSFLVILKGYEEQHGDKMILSMWRCRSEKLEVLVTKIELQSIRTKLLAMEDAIASTTAATTKDDSSNTVQ